MGNQEDSFVFKILLQRGFAFGGLIAEEISKECFRRYYWKFMLVENFTCAHAMFFFLLTLMRIEESMALNHMLG